MCVVGPSGCGKTTALRIAAGLIRPTRGEVDFAGAPMRGPRRDVAIVFQDYSKALLSWRDAPGNVSLALEAMGTARAERRDRIAALLKRVGLAAFADKYPSQMSGGMQQRLQIARCLAQEPAAMMMDVPFGALDAMTRRALQDEMLEIVRGAGGTIFFVTHDLEERRSISATGSWGSGPIPGAWYGVGNRPAATPQPDLYAGERRVLAAPPQALRLHLFVRVRNRRMKAVEALMFPLVLLVLAEIGARGGGPSDSVAPPSEILAAFARDLDKPRLETLKIVAPAAGPCRFAFRSRIGPRRRRCETR